MTVLAGTLVDRVAEILTRYSMLPPGAGIGVAVSGGADSVVLLHILHRLTSRFQVRLTVLHLNHGLRGAESDADERFVRELSASLNVPFFSECASLPPGNVEQEARLARRSFFARLRASEGLNRIALGHNRSDQAETVLFRLLRGSGTAGLSAMRFVTSDDFIRPLLNIGRQEIRDWALAEGIEWREDASNDDARFTRNRIRRETLPALRAAYNPNLETVLANVAGVAQVEEEYWASEIGAVCSRLTSESSFGLLVDAPALKRLHAAVQRRAIRHLLLRLRGDLRSIDLAHIDGIIALCGSSHGHDRVLVPGVDALRSFDTLLLTTPGKLNADIREYSLPLSPEQRCPLPGSAGSILLEALRLKGVKSETQFCANFKSEEDFPFEVAEINQSVLSDAGLIRPLYVRNWEPGDTIHRPGHHEPEKIKALFGEYRVLLWERRHWPVVVCGGEVVWVRRFGCSSKFSAAGPETAIYRLAYNRAGKSENFESRI